MKPGQVVSLIETAYRLDLPTQQWLERVAETAASALESKHGAMAFRYDASSGNWVRPGETALHRLSTEFVRDFFNQPDMPPEAVMALTRVFTSVRFGSIRSYIDELALGVLDKLLARHGIEDMIGVNGLDPSGRGCMVGIAVPRKTHSSREVHVWHRLGAHISAGNRLRTTLEALVDGDADPMRRAEAVLTPNGKVEHAIGPAEPRTAREALRRALVRIDGARSEPEDARRCVDLWQGLVAGRWSLVEHFERDGKRYYLAHKNDPELAEDRTLTLRERQVLGYAELGHSNKVIGYALGLSLSTVATTLGRARKKVGIQL